MKDGEARGVARARRERGSSAARKGWKRVWVRTCRRRSSVRWWVVDWGGVGGRLLLVVVRWMVGGEGIVVGWKVVEGGWDLPRVGSLIYTTKQIALFIVIADSWIHTAIDC